MLKITCPWCGAREQTEFACRGEAYIARPHNSADLSDRDWGRYVFFRNNPKGLIYERWVHRHGCRRWFIALRDTLSDRFLGFAKPGAPKPKAPSSPRARASVKG